MPVTLKVANVSRVFPVGTTVKAIITKGVKTRDPISGPPAGTELGSAAVAADGSWELAGATEGGEYTLAAEVGGEWRYVTVFAESQGFRGANPRMGSATLVAGKAVVTNSTVTAESRIFLTGRGATNAGSLFVKTVTAGTSFEVESTNGADVRSFDYLILDP